MGWINRLLRSDTAWWLLGIPLWLMVFAVGFGLYYYTEFQHDRTIFCYHGVPISVLDSLTALTPDRVRDVHPPHTVKDFVYFSAQAITTGGFGDITPNAERIRMAVGAEALLGIFMLVTIVALLTAYSSEQAFESINNAGNHCTTD